MDVNVENVKGGFTSDATPLPHVDNHMHTHKLDLC
jgi:hypothetical protein